MAILRKIKEKLISLVAGKKKEPKLKKISALPRTKVKEEAGEFKKEVLGTQETTVEKAKFSTPVTVKTAPRILQELPSRYGQNRIVLQVRDPWWLHTYWEITPDTLENLKHKLGSAFQAAKIILRVYDVSSINFDGTNAHRFFDVEINYGANSWYIDTQGPGRSWCVDIGLRLASGEFILIARSNIVHTPLDSPSWITDEEWMIPEDMFARLYGMGFGFGKSSPAKAWQQAMRRALFSGTLSSGGLASMASPVKRVQKERKFWMVVNTELILYGATEPDAKVTVQGNAIKLKPDGTFSLRFALPDGKQVIPVKGTSADSIDTITITPVVNKETK
ncbi:MAG: DUF4912 domain-containing protein [Candidatus Omnitrophica bacterium]|jgi:hypothetical protein|nr:DUF4912 domain-containing protein [Candidatus Omnitrophota bacterium]